jgi:hypothetical protein
MENWKAIDGHPFYEVSDLGRVRSIDRVIEQPKAKGTGTVRRRLTGRVLKVQKCSNDYLFVVLGRGPMHLVHRLVAIAFIPGDRSLTVNHKDGVRTNNVKTNLEWKTCGANIQHSYDELQRKQHAWTRRVVVGGVEHESLCAAAQALGVTPGSVSSAVRRGHRVAGLEARFA